MYPRNRKYIPFVFISPALGILLFVVIYPLVYSLYLSTTNFSFGAVNTKFIGLENYLRIPKDSYFWNSLKITLIYTFVTSFVGFFIGFGLALSVNRIAKGKRFFRVSFVLPMTVPPVTTGIVWLLIFMPEFSFINYGLSVLGIKGPQWLLRPGWALVSVMIAQIWQWIPFFTLILTAGLLALPQEPYEAALIDGASRWQIFRFLTLPLLRPLILLILLIKIMESFKVFDIVYVMTYGGPARSTQVLSFFIYLTGISYRYLGYASSLSYIMLIVVVIIATALIRILRQVR